ncbi:MAG: hypothetical protein WBL27_11825 [Salinimicrobium sp.]
MKKMILKEVIAQTETAEKPVVKRLQEGKDFHILAIGLKENVVLKEHKTDIPAKLVVIKGQVVFKTDEAETTLGLYDEHVIQVGQLHAVEALKDSLFLVIKG